MGGFFRVPAVVAPLRGRGIGDAFDQLLALQGAKRKGEEITLTYAAAMFRQWAPSLYYAPQLWGTADGVMPYRRFWGEFALLQVQRAQARLQMSEAVTLAMAGPELEGDRREAREAAFPKVRGG